MSYYFEKNIKYKQRPQQQKKTTTAAAKSENLQLIAEIMKLLYKSQRFLLSLKEKKKIDVCLTDLFVDLVCSFFLHINFSLKKFHPNQAVFLKLQNRKPPSIECKN